MAGETVTLTKDNFNDTIDKHDIVFVDFWATWCGPCKAFGPVYEKAAQAHPDAIFAKVDTDAQPELAQAFQISAVPTLMVFREQTIIFEQAGALPSAALDSLITQVKGLDMAEVKKQIDAHEKAHAGGECCGGHEHGHEEAHGGCGCGEHEHGHAHAEHAHHHKH